MAAQTRALVSGHWLADAIKRNLIGPKLRILHTSWYPPKAKRDTKAEFLEKHIPGSSFFDIDACCDKTSAFDHMLPTSSFFSQYVGDLGIGNDTHVVVYDTSSFGSLCAPRVWWMFRVFSHRSVSVLDGGLKHWLAQGFPVTSDTSKPEQREFKATVNQSWVKSYEDVLQNIRTKQVQMVDARSAGRFKGTEREPRDVTRISQHWLAHLSLHFKNKQTNSKNKKLYRFTSMADTLPGHFPSAINIPFTSFLDDSGKELGTEELSRVFREAGVDLEKPIWASCGSGVSACHVALAAHLLGHPGVCIYDGSWAEWFSKASPDLIISEGEKKKM